MKKIRQLVKDWPPQPGGAFDRSYVSPQDLNVTVAEVGPVVNEYVPCKCLYQGKPHTFDLLLEDEETCNTVATLIRQNIGKTLLAIGELEVELTEALPQA